MSKQQRHIEVTKNEIIIDGLPSRDKDNFNDELNSAVTKLKEIEPNFLARLGSAIATLDLRRLNALEQQQINDLNTALPENLSYIWEGAMIG